MEYAKAKDIVMECRDILESSYELLKSDFSYSSEKSSVLVNSDGDLHPGVDKV